MIYILDTVTAFPGYGLETMMNSALGGTESGVIRLMMALGADKFQLVGHPDLVARDATAVVHIRTGRHLDEIAKRAPRAAQIVWHHDLGGAWVADDIAAYVRHKPAMVFLTEYHKLQFIDRGILPYTTEPAMSGAYVINYAMPPLSVIPEAVVNPNKLLFASSPHKGLKQTLELFDTLRQQNFAELELHICNPGYMADTLPLPENAFYLGALPTWRVWEEMATSLCLFHINHVFPETFGVVYTEANLLGCPVIAHPLGSLPELLDKKQLVDTRNVTAVTKLLTSIRQERFLPELKTLTGVSKWKDLLKC